MFTPINQNSSIKLDNAIYQSNTSVQNAKSTNSKQTFDDIKMDLEISQLAAKHNIKKSQIESDLKKLALPSWQQQYGNVLTTLNGGVKFDQLREINDAANKIFGDGSQFTESNPAPQEWKDKVHAFKENFPAMRAYRTEQSQKLEFESEIKEYGHLRFQAMEFALKENNFTHTEYNENIKETDKVRDEQVHQSYRSFLTDNPRAVQIMKLLNIPVS